MGPIKEELSHLEEKKRAEREGKEHYAVRSGSSLLPLLWSGK